MTGPTVETHPEIERFQIERLREMPPWRKMALVAEMNRAVHSLALAGLRQRYLDDTPAQRRRRLADLVLGATGLAFKHASSWAGVQLNTLAYPRRVSLPTGLVRPACWAACVTCS